MKRKLTVYSVGVESAYPSIELRGRLKRTSHLESAARTAYLVSGRAVSRELAFGSGRVRTQPAP